MLTILIAIIAILISYYGVISKRPRVFFKILPVFIDEDTSLNLKVTNCGDKPAFDVKIILEDNVEKFMDLYTEEEYRSKIKELDSLIFKGTREDAKIRYTSAVNLLNELEKYRNLRDMTKHVFSSSFNQTIKFISGGDDEIIALGKTSIEKGSLKYEFEIHSKISFNDEFKLDFITKRILIFFLYIFKFLLNFFYFMYSILISFLHHFGLYPIISYIIDFIFIYKWFINFLDKNNISIDLANSRIIVNYKYDYDLKFRLPSKSKSPYSESEKKLDAIYGYIDSKNKDFFINSTYQIWERKLTKDELNIMTKYRIFYGCDYDKYIDIYDRLYDSDCDEYINKKNTFKKKYEDFIQLMYNSDCITEDQRNKISTITVYMEAENERKKRRK